MPPPDPYTLSGYDNFSSDVVIESFDSNYKLFKDVNGEVFARYIRTNCRNGAPVKQIWVLKELVTNLPMNADASELRKSSGDSASKGPEYDHISAITLFTGKLTIRMPIHLLILILLSIIP